MSGTLVGELILWLIVAIVVIAIVVYIVNWLYHRSSKEVSFVRTGLLGERVVINGGAFVLPFIHDFTPVNMNVLPMGIVRAKHDAVITRDRMRIDIEADFYVRVQAPLIDSILADIGVEGGSLAKMPGLIREARDMQGIKESARKGGQGKPEGKPDAPPAAGEPAPERGPRKKG